MVDFNWLHILRPWWLLAIPCILFASWLWRCHISDLISGINRIDPELRDGMITGKSGVNQLSFFTLILCLLLTALALSGPGWSTIDKPVATPLQATFIVLDLSYSMAANDTKPSRYKRAQFKITDFVKRYREQGPFAMIAYAGDAYVVVPLTDDVETLLNFVDDVYPGILPTRGSRPETAFAMVRQIEEDNELKASRILLITDGISQSSLSAIAEYVRIYSLDLSILAVGEKSGVPITTQDGNFLRQSNGDLALATFDLPSLERLASMSEARIARLTTSNNDLTALFGDNLTSINDSTKTSDATEEIPADQGYLLLLLILPLALVCMRRGIFIHLILFMLLPDTSWAITWQDLWQSEEYQAEKLLKDGNYQQVNKLSKDANKIGAVHYRQKQYQKALEYFDELESAAGRYNAGNSFMQLEAYDLAIERYQQALENGVDNKQLQASIEKNLEIARQLLDEQQKQNQAQQDRQSQEQQNQQSQKSSQKDDQTSGQEQKASQQQSQQQSQKQRGQQAQQGTQNEQQEESGEELKPQDQDEQQQIEQIPKDDNETQSNEEAQTIVSKQEQLSSEQKSREGLLLNVVKDNPGDLLKRKFQLQQRQRESIDSHDPL